MDFELSAEQEDLRDQFRRLLTDCCDHETRRGALGKPGAVDRRLWARLAETGFFALRLSEEDGGLGAGMVEAVIVQEEVGRAALPGPVAATALLAGYFDGAGPGETVVTVVFAGSAPQLIENLEGADAVAAISPTGIQRVHPAQLAVEAIATPLDPLTPIHRIVAPLPDGGPLVDPAQARRIWWEGTLLTAATQVGLGAGALEMATDYAQQRTQFGRPIGGFQAVKHLLADSLAEVEVARAAVHAAAVAIDEDGPQPELARAVACARLLATRAAQRSTRACIQVHGGMGYTWELDAHLYLKRALVLDTHFATPRSARAELLATL